MLRHTITEKDVLTWTKTKEKKDIYLKWGKICKKKKKKKKKKKSKRQRKSVRLKISERIKK